MIRRGLNPLFDSIDVPRREVDGRQDRRDRLKLHRQFIADDGRAKLIARLSDLVCVTKC